MKKLLILASLALLLAAVVFGRPEHAPSWWEGIPGIAALIGFAGCWLIVAGSKALGHRWLERPEGYYDDPEHDDPERGGAS